MARIGDYGKEEDEKDRGEEYSGEDGRGEADRTAARTAVARRMTTTANRRAGTTPAVDEVTVAEKQIQSWR